MQNDTELKSHICQAFLRRVLGKTAPLENTPEVLDFLVRESDQFSMHLQNKQRLYSARSTLVGLLEKRSEELREVLAACGIAHMADKFRCLEVACLFAGPTIEPSVDNLILAYLQWSTEISQEESTYHRLLVANEQLHNTAASISAHDTQISKELSMRLHQDTEAYLSGNKMLHERADQYRASEPVGRVPDLDITYVTTRQEELHGLKALLDGREAVLQDFENLPSDLDQVLLENDRMQRHLERLDQERKDLFRSIRR